MILKTKLSLIVLLFIVIFASGCSSVGKNKISEDDLSNFVIKIASSLNTRNSTEFKSMIDQYGLFSITYFVDQRDPNSVIHLEKDEIRDDLVLVDKNDRMGITLSTMFAGFDILQKSDITILETKELTEMEFDIDWKKDDASIVNSKLDKIIKTCQEINLKNNEFIPQIFVLKDNYFAFAISNGTMDPEPEFTGDWVIFEKVDDNYYIRAVLQLT